MYVRDICCGNCGSEISIEKEVDYNDVVSFYCPNCCQFRKEQIKYDKTDGEKMKELPKSTTCLKYVANRFLRSRGSQQ